MPVTDVTRWLRWYGPDDRLAGEVQLDGVTVTELQKLFGVPADNPMYDCWPVTEEHVESLRGFCAAEIDLGRFAYFVEAEGN